MSALVRSFKTASLRKRLWLGFGVVAMIFVTMAAANPFLSKDKAVSTKMLFHDFLAFYTAGTFVREGHADKLYDLNAVRDFQKELAVKENLDINIRASGGFGPFWNPPFYAWIFSPLSKFPYHTAVRVWVCINLVCGAIAITLLCQMLGGKLNDKLLIPAILIVAMPFQMAINHAQNTLTSLLLLVLVVMAWRARKAILAGLLCGVLFYKPQLGAIIALMLIITLGWRAIIGLAITGSILLVITLVTMPGSLQQWLHQLPINVHIFQVENKYLWERHVTLKAFWRMLFQGRAPGEMVMAAKSLWILTAGLLGIGLLMSAVRTRAALRENSLAGIDSSTQLDRLISVTIVAMPLLMPFYFDYDLLLISVSAVLLAAERYQIGSDSTTISTPLDRWMIGIWTLTFVWMIFNPWFGETTGVNVTVILLSSIAVMLIARTWRGRLSDHVPQGAFPVIFREAT